MLSSLHTVIFFFEIEVFKASFSITLKSKTEISSNFVTFSEYMNFISRLEKSDGEVAVFDATNTTRERRKYLYQRVVLEKGNNFVSSFEINRSSIFQNLLEN